MYLLNWSVFCYILKPQHLLTRYPYVNQKYEFLSGSPEKFPILKSSLCFFPTLNAYTIFKTKWQVKIFLGTFQTHFPLTFSFSKWISRPKTKLLMTRQLHLWLLVDSVSTGFLRLDKMSQPWIHHKNHAEKIPSFREEWTGPAFCIRVDVFFATTTPKF